MHFDNAADELVYNLIYGKPTPRFAEFEVVRTKADSIWSAFAVIETPDGQRHEIMVTCDISNLEDA